MSNTFDPYHEWLAIPPEEQPANHYRLLGIAPFEAGPKVIANAADQRMSHLKQFGRTGHAEASQKLLNEVARARVCLLDEQKKAAYDAELRRQLGHADGTAEAPAIRASAPAAAGASGSAPLPMLLAGGAAAAVLVAVLGWWLLADGRGSDAGPGAAVAAADPEKPAPLPPPAPPEASALTPSPAEPTDVADPEPPEPEPAETTAVTADPPEEPEDASDPEPDSPSEPDSRDPNEEADPPAEQPSDIETAPDTHRAKVPDRAVQQQVLHVLDETFQTAAVREPDAKLELSKELAALAEEAQDPKERFVLLRRASELASEAGDAQRMLELVARIAEQFEVDRLTAQAGMLHGFAKGATSEAHLGSLAASSATVIDDALAADRFELAESLADAVHRACLGSAGRPFRVEALQRRREVQSLREQWTAVEAARQVLEDNPDDEAAHATLGRWYALVRQDWNRAAGHLAKGADGELKTLAQRELDRPPAEPADQVELADAWWDLAAASGREWQPALRVRAAYWYKAARPRVESPIVAAKVTRRLDELAGSDAEPLDPDGEAPKPVPERRPAVGQRPPDIGIETPDQIPVGKVREHTVGAEVRQLNASADGRVYASAAWSSGVTCWNTGTGEIVLKLPIDHTYYGVSLSPDGRHAIFGGRSPTLDVFDVTTEEQVRTIPVKGWHFAQALSQDGKHLLVGTEYGARLLDWTRGIELLRFRGSGGWVEDVCFSGNERFVGTASTDKTARIHLLPTGQEVAKFSGHNQHVRSIALSPDGRFALSGGDDKMARLWDVASGRELQRVEHQGEVWGTAITANGRYGLSAGGDLQLWDLRNGRQVAQFERAGNRLALLPDNRFALTASGRNVYLWRLPLTASGIAFEGEHEKAP